jgi:glycosyltransferase Alg8
VPRALANIRRWSGNSLRHGWRAFKLGPQKLSWFCWYSLLDQRLAIWTVLVGPLFALLAVCAGRIELAAAYLLWVMVSRLCHSAIAWRHGRRLSAFYVPLQIASDWVTSIIKAWTLFHPAKQAWLNRGARRLDAQKTGASPRLRAAAAHYLYAFACVTMVILIGTYTRFMPVISEAPLFIDGKPEGVGDLPVPLDERGSGPVVMFGTDRPSEDGAHPRTHASSSSTREIGQSRMAAAAPPPRPLE